MGTSAYMSCCHCSLAYAPVATICAEVWCNSGEGQVRRAACQTCRRPHVSASDARCKRPPRRLLTLLALTAASHAGRASFMEIQQKVLKRAAKSGAGSMAACLVTLPQQRHEALPSLLRHQQSLHHLQPLNGWRRGHRCEGCCRRRYHRGWHDTEASARSSTSSLSLLLPLTMSCHG